MGLLQVHTLTQSILILTIRPQYLRGDGQKNLNLCEDDNQSTECCIPFVVHLNYCRSAGLLQVHTLTQSILILTIRP